MNVAEIKRAVMHQTNNDADDLGDFLPYLMAYINEGYDQLVYAYASEHIAPNSDTFGPLSTDNDSPQLPHHMHRAIVDWATWCVYRNGNPQKQQRGLAFRTAFQDRLTQIRSEGGRAKGNLNKFYNIPR